MKIKLKREYQDFKVTPEYIDTLPDLQNSADSYIPINQPIEHVGIKGFELPVKYETPNNGDITLKTSVTGTVSLEGHKKGINMSRIVRTFYEHKDGMYNIDTIEKILNDYREKLGSFTANIFLKFSYPLLLKSLRSDNEGYQYYNVMLEGRMDKSGKFRKFMHLDFVYSSACPCSFELSLHAMENRGIACAPHSQRSIVRVSVEFSETLWIEELIQICRNALQTEVQVIVKREDEQAFAEMNGAYLKFVEDAIRLLYDKLNNCNKIIDFKAICTHMESLHKHDAIAVTSKGISGGFDETFDPCILTSMVVENM